MEELPQSSQFILTQIATTTTKQLPLQQNNFIISIMKLISIIFVASSVASTTLAAERGLQTLARKWNITDPSFTYDALGFDLDYEVSDFIDNTHTLHTLWTSPGCQEGGTAVPPTVLSSTRPVLTGADYNPVNNGNGVRDQKLTVGVNAATIAASEIYVEDTTVGAVTATIDFCVRFSLLTTGAEAVEVNFLETLVTLFVDLSGSFEIGEVNVEPKIQITNTANQVYLLDGYQCDANDAELIGTDLTDTRNQGSVIRVCVRPDGDAIAAGITMRSLDEFTFTRDNGPAGPDVSDISQPAIIGYNTEATNGLTSLTCSNGVDVCVFETILFAAFYSAVGVVLGSGTGSMQFGAGGRRLRALQGVDGDRSESAATSDFDLYLGVLANGPPRGDNVGTGPGADQEYGDDSGAATSGVMAATALVMAGAFALI